MFVFLTNISNKEDKSNHWLKFSVTKTDNYIITIDRFSGEKLTYHCLTKEHFLKVISKFMGKKYLWKNNIVESPLRYWVYDDTKETFIRMMAYIDNKWVDLDTVVN